MSKYDFSDMSRKKLKSHIKSTQKLLSKLEAELELRQEEVQHETVENMEDYLEETNKSILSLTDAIKKVMGNA
ncbi:hypothetical protein QGN29_03670 [Temperatibacter marinus]|uniref:Uncharacterized protein n=1 Tax=Temperatibacter marinus TaxID=1456591 RepID=A0AA52EJ55_9PROT|nr:hypothetical protein [Temperatibacter marinus]WND03469.1 hypothetical protein QGN29_03670 [Temperatibacter marinus]